MIRIATVLMGTLLGTVPTRAQGPTAPGTPLALLLKPRVQKELKLDDEQTDKIKELHAAVRENPKAADSAFMALEKALKPDQFKRLKQISYQVRGGAAVGDSDMARDLELTAEQKKELLSIWVNDEKTLWMYLKVARFRNKQYEQEWISYQRYIKTGKKMLAVLTDSQRKKFAELKGDKFDTTGLDFD
jgi:Spy/CpxP family protein refolding chaperone